MNTNSIQENLKLSSVWVNYSSPKSIVLEIESQGFLEEGIEAKLKRYASLHVQ